MITSILNIFFPKVCYACHNLLNDNEETICVDCRHDLPITNFHFDDANTIKNVLYGRAKIEYATALFRFEKAGNVQQLIHNLKYRRHEHIGFYLGNWLGGELKIVAGYSAIDVVIPVPLHEKKLKTRGYNQVAKFGQQIAKALKADYQDSVLLKVYNAKSQSKKKRIARWRNNDELFAVQNISILKNKHILLVDDVITTGATLEACISVLNEAEHIKISIAVMAIA